MAFMGAVRTNCFILKSKRGGPFNYTKYKHLKSPKRIKNVVPEGNGEEISVPGKARQSETSPEQKLGRRSQRINAAGVPEIPRSFVLDFSDLAVLFFLKRGRKKHSQISHAAPTISCNLLEAC